jgi:hypothetical protein
VPNTKHPRPRKPSTRKSNDVNPRGPKPDVLTIDGDWQEAIKKSFQKKKPAGGWPK